MTSQLGAGRTWLGQLRIAFDRFVNRSIEIQVTFSVALMGVMYLMLGRFVRPNILNVDIHNVLSIGTTLFLGLLIYCGYAGLRRTAFDTLTFCWLLLAIASHVYASIALERLMFEQYLLLYLLFILAMWMLFRVLYAATIVRPKRAIIAFQWVVISITLFAGILQILQNNGPVTGLANDISTFILGGNQQFIEILAGETNRPTAWYGGPNIVGFNMCLLIGMVCSLVLVYIKRMTWPQTIAAGLAILLAMFVCVNAQSRSSVATAFIFIVFTLFVLVRQNQHGKVLVLVSMATVILTMVSILGAERFGYLLSVFDSGFKGDLSYSVRVQFFQDWLRVANEAAAMGIGISQVNNPMLSGIAGYDFYYVPGIDNEWANIYQAHGITGIIFLGIIYFYALRLAYLLTRINYPVMRLIGWQLGFLVMAYILFGFGSVRLFKYDTGGMFAMTAGIAEGLRYLVSKRGAAQRS